MIRQEHIAFAKKLLDMQVPPYAVALQLQSKFDLSRATSWRDVQDANAQRGSEDDGGLHATQPMLEMRDTLMNLLYQAALTACVDGDAKALPRLTKEIRELMKVGGPGAGRHPDDGAEDETQLLEQIQYIYNNPTRKDGPEEATLGHS